jgi:transposase-like protein
MTKPMMDLRALVEKSGDADLLREMIGFAAERLMELEVGAKTGADYGEKSTERLAQRNGYRDRDWRTRAGSVELRIPPAHRLLFSVLSRAAALGGEGADGRDPGSLCPRRINAVDG